MSKRKGGNGGSRSGGEGKPEPAAAETAAEPVESPATGAGGAQPGGEAGVALPKGGGGSNRPFFIVVGVLALAAIIFVIIKAAGPPRLARLTIFTSGHTMGYLENCGCSRGQTGGVQRRARIIEVEREEAQKPIRSDHGRGVQTLVIDTGDFCDPFDPEKLILSGCVVEMMGVIGYDSVGIGAKELGLRQKDLLDLLKHADLPYTAANLTFSKPKTDEDHSTELAPLVKPYLIVDKGGYKVGIIHILDPQQFAFGMTIREGYDVEDPNEIVAQILKEHKREAQLWLVTASAMSRRPMDLNALGAEHDVTLVYGFRADNPQEPENATQVVFPKFIERNLDKGKDLLVTKVTFPRKGGTPIIESQKKRVDDTYVPPDNVQAILSKCKQLIEEYQIQNDTQIVASFSGYRGPKYMGWQSCEVCHSDIVKQLSGSKHMQAYKSLLDKGRQLTTCMKCHSVGYMRPGGWNSLDEKKFGETEWDRRNVQCENCHGPGEFHIQAMQKNPPKDLRSEGRDSFGLLPVTQHTCKACHDGDNDPHFDFATYWPKIQHFMTDKAGNEPKSAAEVPVGRDGDGVHANGGGPHIPGMGPPQH